VDFWHYRVANTTTFQLEYYDGTNYDAIVDLNTVGSAGDWQHYQHTITDSQYFKTNFRIRFYGGGDNTNRVYIDDVLITKDTGETLIVSTTGTGSGTVTSSPAGITCPGDCSELYATNTLVTLTAVAGSESTFTGWSGGGCSGTGTCQVAMSAARTVTATFMQSSVTLTVNVTGSGTVNQVPAAPYLYGDVVQLTAVPATGWHFTGWSGDLSSSTSPEIITLNGDKTVTATFTQLCYTLTTSVTPGGSGSVNANPAPNCNGGTQYTHGTEVSLTAVASTGYGLANWTGDLSGSTNPQTVTMDSARSVTAVFTLNAVSLTVNVTGGGTVNQTPSGPYFYGDVVQLTAVPNTGWHFVEWTGGLSGSNNPESITMNGDRTVTAVFARDSVTLTIIVVGNGTVNQVPLGPYLYGDEVQLTAVAGTGWQFSSWSGDLTGTTNPATITLDGNKTVTVTFTQIIYKRYLPLTFR
jgi:uncharacterized repeat protein (TIGR02543 family)